MTVTALFERDRGGLRLNLSELSPRRVLARWLMRGANWSLDELDQWMNIQAYGQPTSSGTNISPQTSLQIAAVYACVKVLVEDTSHLPAHIYERLPTGGRRREPSHALDRIFGRRFNSEMSSMQGRMTMMGHVATWGNAYAEIVRNGTGQPVELWPLRPDKMTPTRNDKRELVYDYDLPTGETKRLRRSQIFHLAGWGFDGIRGYNPIDLHREGIGLAKATEQFGATFFGNGAHPGGIIEYPGKLSDKALENYRKSVQEAYGGLGKAHRLMVLEQGLKYHQVGLPPETSQYLETRKFQVIEIARMFRMQPHKVASLEDGASYSSIEQQNIDYVTGTLMPWLVLCEQAVGMQLMTDAEADRYYLKHNVAALMRGDYKSRQEGLHIMRQDGIINADEWRELEEMNPQPDGQGSVYLINGNMARVDRIGETQQKDRSHMTVNEKRIEDGLPPIPGGDAIFLPATNIPALEFPEEEEEEMGGA